jgi:hypothetical protein
LLWANNEQEKQKPTAKARKGECIKPRRFFSSRLNSSRRVTIQPGEAIDFAATRVLDKNV